MFGGGGGHYARSWILFFVVEIFVIDSVFLVGITYMFGGGGHYVRSCILPASPPVRDVTRRMQRTAFGGIAKREYVAGLMSEYVFGIELRLMSEYM